MSGLTLRLLVPGTDGDQTSSINVSGYDELAKAAKSRWRAVHGKGVSFRMLVQGTRNRVTRDTFGGLTSNTVVVCEAKDKDKDKEKSKSKSKAKSKSKSKDSSSKSKVAIPEGVAFGDFDIVRTVGTGTFGRVLLASYGSGRDVFAIKCLRKADVLRQKQLRHVLSETQILMSIQHPYIVNMVACFQDRRNIYMVLDYVCGGELFTYLGNLGSFTLGMTVFFASEILLVIEYLHTRGIVYRDLKPENVLIARDGHIRLADFGFAKHLNDATYTVCGTVDYLAPEIIKKQGHGFGVDLWALGVLIFEMLAGVPPFDDDSQIAICTRILEVDLDFPPEFDGDTIDIVEQLCEEDEEARLGCGPDGFVELKGHPFFSSVDWDAVAAKRAMPPFVPAVTGDDDSSCFPDYDEVDVTLMEPEDEAVDQSLFAEFCLPPK